MFLLSSTHKSEGVANVDPFMKISWCYDPCQRSSQRRWWTLIPQQDKFMFFLSSTYKSEGVANFDPFMKISWGYGLAPLDHSPHSLSSTKQMMMMMMMVMMMMMMMILLKCGATSGLEGACLIVAKQWATDEYLYLEPHKPTEIKPVFFLKQHLFKSCLIRIYNYTYIYIYVNRIHI